MAEGLESTDNSQLTTDIAAPLWFMMSVSSRNEVRDPSRTARDDTGMATHDS